MKRYPEITPREDIDIKRRRAGLEYICDKIGAIRLKCSIVGAILGQFEVDQCRQPRMPGICAALQAETHALTRRRCRRGHFHGRRPIRCIYRFYELVMKQRPGLEGADEEEFGDGHHVVSDRFRMVMERLPQFP